MAILPFPVPCETTELPDLPPLVSYLLLRFLSPILTWVTAQVFQAVLARCATHPLVRLATSYDATAVVAACATYYHHSGPGKPPTYTVHTLVHAEIVRAWADSCSDPALEWHLASNLIVRWYVGLPLLGPTPDHTTLNRFHRWLSLHYPDALFRDVLTFLDHVDPEDPATTPQIVDTFAMASPVTPTSSSARLLLLLCTRLTRTWLKHAPLAAQTALPPLDLGALAPPSSPPHTREQQQAQLEQAVTVAAWLVTALTPALASLDTPCQTTVQQLLAAISKVIADETTTATGVLRERPRDDKGHYRIMSAVDLEATFRKHQPDPAVLGTNALVSTTTTRIRAAVICTGSTPDQDAPVAVLRQQQAASQPLPPFLIMDQAGGMGKTRAQVQVVSNGQTRMVAQIPHTGSDSSTHFTPANFHLSSDGLSCTCPQGVTSQRRYQDVRSEGSTFRFFGGDCRGCPFWQPCRGAASKPTSQRSVYLSPYHTHLREAAAFNATVPGKMLLRCRWQVEPTIAWVVRYNGCRKARRVGVAAAQCQLFQACAVRNLQRWLQRLAHSQHPKPLTMSRTTAVRWAA